VPLNGHGAIVEASAGTPHDRRWPGPRHTGPDPAARHGRDRRSRRGDTRLAPDRHTEIEGRSIRSSVRHPTGGP